MHHTACLIDCNMAELKSLKLMSVITICLKMLRVVGDYIAAAI